MKKFGFLYLALVVSGCGIISKQYNYEPSVRHQTFKGRMGHTDRKMIYNKFAVLGAAGDSIGSVVISNGTGHPLLMGPVLPVVPVGGFFQKSDSRFVMELTVHCNEGYFLPLAIGSSDDKRVGDSLRALGRRPNGPLQTTRCYMMVDDTLKVPLRVREVLTDDKKSHSYWIEADTRFKNVKTMKLVTGNALLDSTLKQVVFTRNSRIKFDLVGPGY